MSKQTYSPKEPADPSERPPRPSEAETFSPPPQPQFNTGRSLGQILIVLVVLLVLVNIPLNYGFGVAQLKPESAPVVVKDGMLLKGSGPQIYVLEDHKLRWISSPESFNRYFSQHRRINLVEDRLLQRFDQGQPIRYLVKCAAKPQVYTLTNGHKQLVKDPLPINQVRAWDKVHLVTCSYLQQLPTTESMSEGAARPSRPGMAAGA